MNDDNFVIYRDKHTKEIKKILNHNKIERNVVIEKIKEWNGNIGQYENFIELVENEKEIEFLKFIFKLFTDETLQEKVDKLEYAIEEITQIIARV